MSSVSNGLYFLTVPLVSVMRVIYRKIRHALYLYIKRNVEKVWGARYTLGTRYFSKKKTVIRRMRLACWITNATHTHTHTHTHTEYSNFYGFSTVKMVT